VMAATEGKGVDRVIEVDIAANAAIDAACVRSGGEVVVYGSGQGRFELEFFPMILKNIDLRFFIVYNLDLEDRARAINTLRRLLEKGAVQHNITHRIPLQEVARAHQLVETAAAGGNVVLRVG
jgi:NADPH:quinone reductase